MLELGNEFMMALFIGSTSFAGLTAVVIGQVINSSHPKRAELKKFLAFSFAAGILAATFAFAWFALQDAWLTLLAVLAFYAQVIWCWAVTWHFWTT